MFVFSHKSKTIFIIHILFVVWKPPNNTKTGQVLIFTLVSLTAHTMLPGKGIILVVTYTEERGSSGNDTLSAHSRQKAFCSGQRLLPPSWNVNLAF